MKIQKKLARKVLAVYLGLLMAWGNMGAAYAASTDIANVPMAVKNTAAPNVMFTLDDSGSMQWEALPDDMIVPSDPAAPNIYGIYYMFPRAASIYGGADYPNQVVGFDETNRYARLLRSSANNKAYYNPAIRYSPWSNADGSSMANAVTTAAYHNPANTAAGTRNLTINNTPAAALWWKDDSTWTNDSRTFYPATYFNYLGGNIWAASSYTKVEIKSTTTFSPKAAARTDCAGATCTYTEEMQNFANWYTYYRSRVLSARAGVGKAFAQQGGGMRVGFGAINKSSSSVDSVSTATVISGVRAFSGADRTNFFTTLYGHTIPAAATPLRRAMDDVGQYFSRTDDMGPWGENPGVGGGTQFSCRQNYHILTTDGYWNGASASTAAASNNVDNTAGATISKPTSPPPTAPTSYTYSPANPYSDSWSDTLADIAMYYWNRDLRSDLANNVPANSKDPAFWQHMVNFTVGLGVVGTVSQADIDSAFTSSPATITWLDPTLADANKLDDLAHAAINSRGGFFSAADPNAFAKALSDALNDIVGRDGAAAAVAVSNPNITSGDNASYASEYNSGTWAGDLKSFAVDLVTGIPSTTNSWTNGGAQAQLDATSVTAATRKVATYSDASSNQSGIQFQATSAATTTKLSAAQQTLLNTPTYTDGANVLAFIRGDRSLEGVASPLPGYRVRASRLGDIINAEPVILNPPRYNYADSGYAAFKTANASRAKLVLQGGNDGMLHAFGGDPVNGGDEKWAYVPSLLFSNLNMLSRKSGFQHQYYVDATPTLGDVDFSNTDGVTGNPAPNWKTILVGGLGKGGRGFYALDATNPSAATEADVAAKVLWEFPNNSTTSAIKLNVGHSFGKPVIVKTAAKGWVVLVTSGYNNGTDAGSSGGDGNGHLFVLNPRTGAVIADIPTCTGNCSTTAAGSPTNPSGLAQISAFVDESDLDNTLDFAYGGDLLGNVWRFDLKGNVNQWGIKKLATLVNASSQVQPVTTVPELGEVNGQRMVYVGTGQYLGDKDVPGATSANASATQTQSMYGLMDDILSSTPLITPLRSNLVQQTLTTTGNQRVASSNIVDLAVKKGWYIDLPDTGERVVTDPALAVGALVFTTNIPSSNACTPGGSSWFYVLDYKTGGFLQGSTVAWSAQKLGDTLASRPVVIKLPSGAMKQIIRKSDASNVVPDLPVPASSLSGRRVSWRELIN